MIYLLIAHNLAQIKKILKYKIIFYVKLYKYYSNLLSEL